MADTIDLIEGKKYGATIHLSGLESWASNDQVANYFADLGFYRIVVEGSGAIRTARGTWNKPDVKGFEIPTQVSDIKVLDEDVA